MNPEKATRGYIFLSVSLVGIALLASLVASDFRGSEEPNWSRDLAESATSKDTSSLPLYVGVITSVDNQLYALCGYRYVKGGRPTLLQGRTDPDGNFWSTVSYEVATEGKKQWMAIGKANQADSGTLNLNADHPRARLYVDMEQFRPFIRAARWGRIRLENGDAGMFALEDLLPPAACRTPSGDFKEILDLREEERFGSSAILYSVASVGDRLTGDFTYSRRRSLARLHGARTPDDDFWPLVTFYVGNSEHDWRPLGTSSHSGAPVSITVPEKNPTVLRVNLDVFKAAIGKYKYGKVVFSDGSFAIFLNENLSPKR